MYMNILYISWTIRYELSINFNQGEMISKNLIRINTEENTTTDKLIHLEWTFKLGYIEKPVHSGHYKANQHTQYDHD